MIWCLLYILLLRLLFFISISIYFFRNNIVIIIVIIIYYWIIGNKIVDNFLYNKFETKILSIYQNNDLILSLYSIQSIEILLANKTSVFFAHNVLMFYGCLSLLLVHSLALNDNEVHFFALFHSPLIYVHFDSHSQSQSDSL